MTPSRILAFVVVSLIRVRSPFGSPWPYPVPFFSGPIFCVVGRERGALCFLSFAAAILHHMKQASLHQAGPDHMARLLCTRRSSLELCKARKPWVKHFWEIP